MRIYLFTRHRPSQHRMLSTFIKECKRSGYLCDVTHRFLFCWVTRLVASANSNGRTLLVCDDPVAMILSFFYRPFVHKHRCLWSLEIYHAQYHNNTIFNLSRNLFFFLCSVIAYRVSDSIVFPSHRRMLEAANAFTNHLTTKSKIVFNIPTPLEDFSSLTCPRRINFLREAKQQYFTLSLYAGVIDESTRSIGGIVKAFRELPSHAFFICGPLSRDLDVTKFTIKLPTNVFYLGHLSHQELAILYGTSLFDYGFLSYDNSPDNVRYCCPTKMWEYLHYGIKIIGNRNFSLLNDWADYIDFYYDDSRSLQNLFQGQSAAFGIQSPILISSPRFDLHSFLIYN
jgi:hypothetical protein